MRWSGSHAVIESISAGCSDQLDHRPPTHRANVTSSYLPSTGAQTFEMSFECWSPRPAHTNWERKFNTIVGIQLACDSAQLHHHTTGLSTAWYTNDILAVTTIVWRFLYLTMRLVMPLLTIYIHLYSPRTRNTTQLNLTN